MTAPTRVPQGSFRNERPYPFCPGCGHSSILDKLNEALRHAELDPSDVVIVSDIGCSGLSDQYFSTHAFHGLHGRSITYATGIKLANPKLNVIVIMGDGGTGIGGAHLIAAARRNIGITVLVLNNFNFGMTGGQHSTTTPIGASTSTTPGGNIERPLDICGTVGTNGANFVYRGTNFDSDLSRHMADAIRQEGFALLDVWELCTAHFVPRNKASKKTLQSMLERLEFESGVLQRREHPEFSAAYRESVAGLRGKPVRMGMPLRQVCQAALTEPYRLVVAGSAGSRVLSAARLATQAAVLAGLWATQKDDYPITVKSGHSVAEILMSPTSLEYTGIDTADALVVLSNDGLGKMRQVLARMDRRGTVFVSSSVDLEFQTEAEVFVIDPNASPKRVAPLAMAQFILLRALHRLGVLPFEALEAAIASGPDAYREENMELLRAAWL
jgi:pyruvate/2-oxoacid:ferredoxin oxidoreductase beta subunit/Pyruvate/2-oxoacid:ferredoxin oxidoreductase gamma subunit